MPETLEEARSLAREILFGGELKLLEGEIAARERALDPADAAQNPELSRLKDERSRVLSELEIVQWKGTAIRIRGSVSPEDRMLEAHLAGLEDGIVNLCGDEALPSGLAAEGVPPQNPPTPEDLEWLREALYGQWRVITVFDCARDVEVVFDWPDIYFSWDSGVVVGTAGRIYQGTMEEDTTIWCEVRLNPQLRGTSAGALAVGALFGNCAGFPLPEQSPSEPPSEVQRAMLYREYPGLDAGP